MRSLTTLQAQVTCQLPTSDLVPLLLIFFMPKGLIDDFTATSDMSAASAPSAHLLRREEEFMPGDFEFATSGILVVNQVANAWLNGGCPG